MALLALSVNHADAPLALRERVAFAPAEVPAALAELRGRLREHLSESALLSTCNRTELYCAVRDPGTAQAPLADWLAGELRSHVHALPERAAVRHAFRVASGLESMVLGEPQILGQMKQAVREAQEAGALGAVLSQLFQRAFAVGKAVRCRTGIGASCVSLAAAAIRLAQRSLPIERSRVLFVGAGAMIDIAARHLSERRPLAMTVANRTPENGERLARRIGAISVPLAALGAALEHAELVVSCTASALPLIPVEMAAQALRLRRGRPILFIDLAVPRDVAPEVASLPEATVYTLDDLGPVVRAGLAARATAAEQADDIVEAGVGAFMRWLEARAAVPALCTLDARARALRERELERAQRRLRRGDSIDSVMRGLAHALSNKFLHVPRSVLASGTLSGEEARELAEKLLPQRP